MARHIDHQKAEAELRRAYRQAKAGVYDTRWAELVNEVWEFSSKTFTPALGTILLARAVDDQVDPGSIKVLDDGQNPNTFSLRSLGHGVLVPLSNELGFSIRTTGREPLNNQPFFRYLHVDEIDRVRRPYDLERYREILAHELSPLSIHEARSALAAYVRVGLERLVLLNQVASAEGAMTAQEVLEGIQMLLSDAEAGPWVVQALGAVFVRTFSDRVVTRKVNDPSIDFPGDVQALTVDGVPWLSLEARNKKVTTSDALLFVDECGRSGVRKAIVLELTGGSTGLFVSELVAESWGRAQVALLVIDNVPQLVATMAALGTRPAEDFYEGFALAFSEALKEVDAPEAARVAWADYAEGGG